MIHDASDPERGFLDGRAVLWELASFCGRGRNGFCFFILVFGSVLVWYVVFVDCRTGLNGFIGRGGSDPTRYTVPHKSQSSALIDRYLYPAKHSQLPILL